jgi:predicted amidophosphoribosyltransferase
MILRSAIDSLAAVLFPAPCRICGAVLLNASRIPICAPCLASFEPIPEPMCDGCGKPLLTPVGAGSVQPRCRLCRDDFFAFDFARSYGVYNDALHHAILLLKYEEVTRLGDWFAARLAEVVAREAEAFRADVVVPVPLHPERQREQRV